MSTAPPPAQRIFSAGQKVWIGHERYTVVGYTRNNRVAAEPDDPYGFVTVFDQEVFSATQPKTIRIPAIYVHDSGFASTNHDPSFKILAIIPPQDVEIEYDLEKLEQQVKDARKAARDAKEIP